MTLTCQDFFFKAFKKINILKHTQVPFPDLVLKVLCREFVNVLGLLPEDFSGQGLEVLFEAIWQAQSDEERPVVGG